MAKKAPISPYHLRGGLYSCNVANEDDQSVSTVLRGIARYLEENEHVTLLHISHHYDGTTGYIDAFFDGADEEDDL